MSEERIKERCKREDIALKIIKGFLEKDCYTDTELEYSLNTLLDLYNKQKEEINELKENQTAFKEMKEELKPLIKGEYISKDKIKHTLLKFQNEYGEDLETTGRLFIGKEVVQYGEDMLDEIAKELDIKLLEE